MSHDMSGTDHCCQATHCESVVKVGIEAEVDVAREPHRPRAVVGERRDRDVVAVDHARDLRAIGRDAGDDTGPAGCGVITHRAVPPSTGGEPQAAIGSRVDQPAAVGQPVERAAAVRNARARARDLT